MPEGVKLSDKSETLHKHVENCMCYHSTIASGQLANAFFQRVGGWLASFLPLPRGTRWYCQARYWIPCCIPCDGLGKKRARVCAGPVTGQATCGWLMKEDRMFKLVTLATGQSIWHSFLKRKIIGEEESDFLKSRIVYLLNCHQEFASLPFFK